MSTHPAALHEQQEVISACTQICKTAYDKSKSCAKILPVNVYPEGRKDLSRLIYTVIDDQSDHSLATQAFLDSFHDNSPVYEYCIVSCAGRKLSSGRRGIGYVIESLDESTVLKLPTLVECSDIPNNRDEIPSPEVALQYPYLHDIAPFLMPVNDKIGIELLIGRDLITAHHVLDQRININYLPYAQRLPLGWAILGQVCLGNAHITDNVNVKKTFILPNGRPFLLEPCESKLKISENLFQRTLQDEKLGMSMDDKAFLQIMDSSFTMMEMATGWLLFLSERTDLVYLTTENRL